MGRVGGVDRCAGWGRWTGIEDDCDDSPGAGRDVEAVVSDRVASDLVAIDGSSEARGAGDEVDSAFQTPVCSSLDDTLPPMFSACSASQRLGPGGLFLVRQYRCKPTILPYYLGSCV
ncbi:MAG TPA: hypothetical protein VNC78_01215 [Actinomycetota bacterium]|nr:hypothetical protein [Actinomycetota bacterium]